MSKIHVLTSDTNENNQIVIHINIPSGNNLANISWKIAGLNSGIIGTTIMTEGVGAGQISSSEKANIIAGNEIEIVTNISAESGGATPQSLDLMVNQIINQKLTDLAKQLKYFGYTQ